MRPDETARFLRVRTTVRLPRRFSYPLFGVGLAQGAPAGLLVVRNLASSTPLGWGWVTGQLRGDALTYIYVAVSTSIAFALLGWLLGYKEDELSRRSTTDALTGLPNRRHLNEQLRSQLKRAQRDGSPLSMLLVDLDGLKSINDAKGHEAGDLALVTVARTLRSASRESDVIGRWGGDEFILLAPGSTAEEALELAQRIRQKLREAESAETGPLSVSVGIADSPPDAPRVAGQLYAQADIALYQAKAAGRDQAVVSKRYSELPPSL